MTPHLKLLVNNSKGHLASGHLTEDQFGELLDRSTDPVLQAAQAHVLACEECAGELASLRESLSLFREATSAYADNELSRLPPVSPPARNILAPALTQAYWLAAAALLVAAILPLQTLRQHAFQPAPALAANTPLAASQSDEALLEDVDSYTSASVPAPMQALADPGVTSTSIAATTQNSDQRKD